MSSFRDDAPPWSFFIPITLAVIVGVLAADAIRYAIGTVLGGDDAPRQVDAAPDEAPVPPAVPRTDARAAGDSGANGAAPDTRAPAAPVPGGVTGTAGVLELPDSMTARRDGDPAACVNGTVANRVEGGWEQALENDAPVPCVILNR